MDSASRLCTICARGGSKGVKNKNVRELHGSPMIAWSVRRAIESGLFAHVIVSTDSDQIADAAIAAGAEAFFRRPPEMASDTAAKLPVIQHAFRASEVHYGREFAVIVDLDATSPLRVASDIAGAVEMLETGRWDNIITGMPARRSPYFNLVEQGEGGRVFLAKRLEKPIARRQDAPRCFDMNASIYAWTRASLLGSERVIGENTGIFVMPEERSIDVDSEIDFKLVELLMGEALSNGTAGK